MSYQPFDLSGKVALVTGGNSGIGLGIAMAVAQAGADVAIWGTNPKKNAAAKDALAKSGRRIVALQCDVGDEKAVDAAMAETIATLGRIDGCFANAGVSGRGTASFLEMTSEEWHRVLRVNLDGAFYTLRAASRPVVRDARNAVRRWATTAGPGAMGRLTLGGRPTATGSHCSCWSARWRSSAPCSGETTSAAGGPG